MDEKSVQRLFQYKCIKKPKEIGQQGPVSLEEMKKLRMFSLYPKLYERIKPKAKSQYKSECSLDPSEVPGIRSKSRSDEKFYLYVDNNIFNKFSLLKHQRNKGQQEKSTRMLQSRNIVTVKTAYAIWNIARTMIKNHTVQQSGQP